MSRRRGFREEKVEAQFEVIAQLGSNRDPQIPIDKTYINPDSFINIYSLHDLVIDY